MKFLSLPLLALLAVGAIAAPAAEPESMALEARGNDYPYSKECPGAKDELDPWRFYKCYCTSFVAFAVNKRDGVKFNDFYKLKNGEKWGDANHWDTAAKDAGIKVDKTPKVGDIAQSNAGSFGHVAYVTKVSGSKVTVEEYNYGCKLCYGTRTVSKTAFDNYIHI